MAKKSETIRLVITPAELAEVVSSLDANKINLTRAGLSYLQYLRQKQFQLSIGSVSTTYIRTEKESLAESLGLAVSSPISQNIKVSPANVAEMAKQFKANPSDQIFSECSAQDIQDIKDYIALLDLKF